jgi:hypothetical protein
MPRKVHTALTAPLVLHCTRIEKYARKKFIINGQWRNKLFLIGINRFSLVKAAMNALRICKLRKNCLTIIDQCAMVLKTPQFLHFLVNSEVGSAIFLGGALSQECYLFLRLLALPFQICQCAKRYSAIAEASAMRYPPPPGHRLSRDYRIE